jgi:predicted PurR-regulated permease PerM
MTAPAERSKWLLLLFALVAAGLILYQLRYILIPFTLAAGLTYIIGPVVNWVERKSRLPRLVVVLFLYLAILGPLAFLGSLYGPAALNQLKVSFNELPTLIHRLIAQFMGGKQIQLMNQTITAQEVSEKLLAILQKRFASPGGIIELGRNAASFLFGGVLTLVVLFYFLASRNLFARVLLRFTPRQHHWRINKFVQGVHYLLGRYLRGIFLIILYASTTAFLGLRLLFDLPYALPLALLSGFLEVLPVVGPVISIALACLMAMVSGGFLLVLQVGGFYGGLRLTIDNVLGPLILGWAAVLHPVMILFAFLAGGTLFGILGLLLAVPVTATIKMVMENWEEYSE